jgi:hypothetical protein
MPFPAIPALLAWTVGALGAAVIARFLVKEHQRVNADLDAARARAHARPDDPRPTLKRDPKTGVYRPQ